MNDGEIVNAFLIDTLARLWNTFSGLFWPALIFTLLAFAIRGFASLRTARAARGEIGMNFALLVFDVIFVLPLMGLLVSAIGVAISQNNFALFAPAQWELLPAWAVAFLAVFIGDFVGYWRHRFEHFSVFWWGHAIHHSDTAMTWTTGFRFHPLNRVTTVFIDTLVLGLLGFPAWALLLNNIVRHHYGLFVHMDLPWTYGPFGRVMVSPAMHRWHHIREADGAGVNFATVFSVFDNAFGTFYVPGPCNEPLGVRDDIGRGVLGQLAWPFKAAWRSLVRRAPRPAANA